MTLSNAQKRKLAGLLGNFTQLTSDRVLSQFDENTQTEIGRLLDAVGDDHLAGNQSLLSSFADFLYFDPSQPSTDRQTRLRHSSSAIRFESILTLDIESLDIVLKMAASELTVALLCCSPQSFIKRVLLRLSPKEAREVIEKINSSPPIGISEMTRIQAEYCKLVSRLVEDGLLSIPHNNPSTDPGT